MMRSLLLSLLLSALPLTAMSQEVREPEHVITVSGTAQVFAAPDEATVRLGVQQEAPTAQEAQSKANTVINAFLAKLTVMKVDKKDIQTSQMSLQPVYDYPPNSGPRLRGYQARDILSVRLTNFELIGKVIDAGTDAGVTNVEGISFGLRNSRGPRAQAYKDAVADARSKADAIVDALGMKITGVYDVHTDAAYAPPIAFGAAMARMDKGGAPTPVEPGQMEVGVTVTIRYRIA